MSKNKFHSTLLAATLVTGGMIMGTAPAYATPGVIFTAFDTLEFAVGSEAPPAGVGSFLSVTPTQLVWRDVAPVGPSAETTSELNILGASNSPVNIVSDAGWFVIADIQHVNRPIPGGLFNFTINMNDAFSLSHGINPVLALPNVVLNVSFEETANLASQAQCEAASPNGVNPVGSLCDDIFTVNNLDLVINSFVFGYDAGFGFENWKLSFDVFSPPSSGTFFDGLTPVGGGTIYTAEGENSRIQVRARIDQVPEPGTLALLGLGLLALPLVARRAAKKTDAKA